MPEEVPLLEVGVITRAHGLRGEVIVHAFSDVEGRFAPRSTFETETGMLTVEQSSHHGGTLRVRFAGVATREAAEALRRTVLLAPPIDDPDQLFIHELIGSTVETTDGRIAGTVTAVQANPASDLLVTSLGHLIPAVFIVSHVPQTTVVVDIPDGLLEL